MKVTRCHIAGFGKLSGVKLAFHDGLNVIWAPNEAGKSTLQRFVTGMLYGPIRSDIKTQRRLDAWADQFRPWRGSDYGGTLWCCVANGRELEIVRTFGREDNRLEIRTSTGEDITRQYPTQRNGDVAFAAEHLGLTKELFESAAVIRETETAVLGGTGTLRDRIANLAQSGDEKLSVRLSLVKLEQALDSVGSERAPTKPYRQALDLVEELMQERAALEGRRRECADWIQEKLDLGARIDQLEKDLRIASRNAAAARYREARLQVSTLEEIDRDIRAMTSEIDSLDADPEFPYQRLDELNRFVADQENIEIQLNDLCAKKGEAEARRAQVESEIRRLSPYSALYTATEPEKITEWFVGWLSLSRQRDDVQRTLNRLGDEATRLQCELASAPAALRDPAVDWERKARLVSEQEREASAQIMAGVEKVARSKADYAAVRGRSRRWWGVAVTGAAVALASAAAAYEIALPAPVGWVCSAVLALFGLVSAVLAVKTGKSALVAKRQVDALESDLQRFREQSEAVQAELKSAVAGSGYDGIEGFLAAARDAVMKRQRLGDLEVHIDEAEKERTRLQLEADAVYGHIKESLTAVGLNCAPGNLKAQVDILRGNMRRYAELVAAGRHAAVQVEGLESEHETVGKRAGEIAGHLREVLASGHADSVEHFRQAAQNCRRSLEIRARMSARMREMERLRGKLTLDQWRERLNELENALARQGNDAAMPAPLPNRLPYQPTSEEAEIEQRRIESVLAATKEESARCVERVTQAFANYRTPAEIEEDLELAERELQNLALNRQALTTAMQQVQSLARLQQEVCAPQLNRAVEDRFLQICPERYEEVKIDPDFRIQVREKATGELRSAESLSRGTQDQLYFSVRFGILELLGSGQESAPCLLDEPFAAYDHERMDAAFSILEREAATRQMLLFTCREEVRSRALLHHAHIIAL